MKKTHRSIASKLWKKLTKRFDHQLNEWINDNRENLHDSALKTEKLKNVNSIQFYIQSTIDYLIMYENDYFSDTSIRQSTLYEIIILSTRQSSLIETSDRSSTWHLIHFSILAILHFVQHHVKEKAKNKNITKDKRDEFQSKSRNLHSETVDLFRFFITYFEIFNHRKRFTSHVLWKVEINKFTTTSIARVFFAQF